MTAKKAWTDLAPATRAKRFAPMAANHLGMMRRSVLPVMTAHSKCRDGAMCQGPGCVFTRNC